MKSVEMSGKSPAFRVDVILQSVNELRQGLLSQDLLSLKSKSLTLTHVVLWHFFVFSKWF